MRTPHVALRSRFNGGQEYEMSIGVRLKVFGVLSILLLAGYAAIPKTPAPQAVIVVDGGDHKPTGG